MFKIAEAVMVVLCLLAACAGPAVPLPHSLYFLDGTAEESQVWRLDVDGSTRVQVTREEAGVDGFAVSAMDGSIAIISDNQLFLLDNDGDNRRLVADASHVDMEAEDSVFRNTIEAPVFSPDGRTLAYSFDGLHLYDLATGEDEHVLTNLGNLLGEPFVFAKEVYAPGPWSPDGSMLLITMGYYEGSTLAVMEPGAQEPFRRLWSGGPVCCLYSWAADSRSVLVANPYYTGQIPGLWRYDATTGEKAVIVGGREGYGPFDFVGWPHQLASGDLFFFHVRQERFSPEVGIPLKMVRSHADGSDLTQVRPEELSVVEALWAQDGSLSVILGSCCGDGRQALLARTDGSPLQVLIDDGQQIRSLAWGP